MRNSPEKWLAESLDEIQQSDVVKETHRYIKQAAEYYERQFTLPPVLFDLKGKAAGMYRVRYRQKVIRYNPFIFARYYADNFQQTIPHEVAHYISDELYGLGKIRPHGSEWKSVMQVFGAEPSRTANYDISGLPGRQYQTFQYQCACQAYQLTSRRHNRVLRGEGHYTCRQCGEKLLFIKSSKD